MLSKVLGQLADNIKMNGLSPSFLFSSQIFLGCKPGWQNSLVPYCTALLVVGFGVDAGRRGHQYLSVQWLCDWTFDFRFKFRLAHYAIHLANFAARQG